MKLRFSTKGQTLETLKGILDSASIVDLYIVRYVDWKEKKNFNLKEIEKIGSGPYIVRSSSVREDTYKNSNAGSYLSLLNINKNKINDAIKEVFNSYGEISDLDEVLIQPMLKNVVFSGVGFSHDPNTSQPYRIINWSRGEDTSIVTSGKGGYVWQCSAKSNYFVRKEQKKVINLIDELYVLFGRTPLDCEFAVTEKSNQNKLWILQVRPLILKNEIGNNAEENQYKRLEIIHKKITNGMKPNFALAGKKTSYGVMPDWNPAEIIGIKPKNLALSLYREIITDSVWAYQRHNYGYRNLRSFPILVSFLGLPYIDVRVSFNSFIPADLNNKIADKLVDFYIRKLDNEPYLHDKVEFSIVNSCYTFDIEERLSNLKNEKFTLDEITSIKLSLRTLTKNIINPKKGLWKEDAKKIEILKEKRIALDQNKDLDDISKIYWLLEYTKRYGSLPFAGLARSGFIAIQLLRSLVNVNIFSQQDYDDFIASLSTITSELSKDRVLKNKQEFLKKYGHLRPGTYDILNPRYDEAPDLYFDWEVQKEMNFEKNKDFKLSLNKIRAITEKIEEHDLEIDVVEFFNFLQAGIEQRELAKFHFTKNVSEILSLIEKFGNNYGISKEDLAFADINDFKELYICSYEPESFIRKSIEIGKSKYKDTIRTTLPPLIRKPEDVFSFEWPTTVPNFITQKSVTASVSSKLSNKDLKGKLVCIPSADPGYDWLFSYEIAGFITAWGGANSHMAIRANELSLPAVIGVGEIQFKKYISAEKLFIDCANKKIEVLA